MKILTFFGIGVYYHFDYVGSPRDYKWINTIQLQKTVEQVSFITYFPLPYYDNAEANPVALIRCNLPQPAKQIASGWSTWVISNPSKSPSTTSWISRTTQLNGVTTLFPRGSHYGQPESLVPNTLLTSLPLWTHMACWLPDANMRISI